MTEQALPTAAPVQTVHLTGAQRVAALMITIGTTAAANVLARLPPEAAERIAAEILNTKAIKPQIRDQVLEETYSALFSHMTDLQGGPSYALELFIEAFGEQKGMDLLEKVTAAQIRPPFDSLLRADPMRVAQLLEQEHPQTIAIVLAYLEPRAAARILTLLDPALQVEVARRIADTGETSRDVVTMVEMAIERKMVDVVQDSAKVGGRKPLAMVLNQVDRTAERQILGSLQELDAEMADEVRKFMFVFEDIGLLDERSMQRLVREIDNKDLALALRNVDEELRSKFFRNMSSRAAEMLRDEMAVAGQVRIKNIEEAQGRIVEIVKRLEDADEIVIIRGGESEFA